MWLASCFDDKMRKPNNRLITFDPGCMAGKFIEGIDNNDNAASQPASQCVKKGGAVNLSVI